MDEDKNESVQDFLTELESRLKKRPLTKPRKVLDKMDQVEKVLPAVLSTLGLERRLREHALMQVWSSLLPAALAERSRPLFIDHQHNLVIAVSNASVAQELSLMKSKLLQALSATARSLGIELRALRMDMKHFHRAEEAAAVEEVPRPQVSDKELVELTLNHNDMQLIGELSKNLSADLATKPELNVMVLRTFERQLRLAEWRRRNGFPICQRCNNPVARLFELGADKVCFNCSVAE